MAQPKGSFTSRGYIHHADSTVSCPGCGRRFVTPTHTVVSEHLGQGLVGIGFKSKDADRQQSGRPWGVIRVPAAAITWGRSHRDAWHAAPPSQAPGT